MKKPVYLLLALMTICSELSAEKPTTKYIPISCMTRVVISDFGECTRDGDRVDCPNVHMSYSIGCVSIKPGDPTGVMRFERPTAVRIAQ